jgi:uncharacterized pyridoxamine 5'-phosphate oxidase family protein
MIADYEHRVMLEDAPLLKNKYRLTKKSELFLELFYLKQTNLNTCFN